MKQLPANRESESRSPIFSCYRAVYLRKGIEKNLLFLQRNSDSGIAYDKMQSNVIGCLQFEVYHGTDLALLRELNRISHQVDQDLLKPIRVPNQRFRQMVKNLPGHF